MLLEQQLLLLSDAKQQRHTKRRPDKEVKELSESVGPKIIQLHIILEVAYPPQSQLPQYNSGQP